MSYLTARLCLYDLRFKGDQFPKSPQDVLAWFKSEGGDQNKPMSVEQWKLVARVLDDAFGE